MVDIVMEFFGSEELLKVLNNIVITLIPKSAHASLVRDYRSIACCYTLYKIISKMLCNRLKQVLPDLISDTKVYL